MLRYLPKETKDAPSTTQAFFSGLFARRAGRSKRHVLHLSASLRPLHPEHPLFSFPFASLASLCVFLLFFLRGGASLGALLRGLFPQTRIFRDAAHGRGFLHRGEAQIWGLWGGGGDPDMRSVQGGEWGVGWDAHAGGGGGNLSWRFGLDLDLDPRLL